MREVLQPTRSVVAAIGAIMAGVGCGVLTVGIALDDALPMPTRILALAMGFVFAAGLLLMGLKLLSGGGGVMVDDDGQRLGIGLTSRRDTWWIARDRVLGLRVVDDDERAKDIDAAWLAVLELDEGAGIVLARHVDRGMIVHVVERLAEALEVPILEGDAAPVGRAYDDDTDAPLKAGPLNVSHTRTSSARGDARFAVSRGAALQWILFFFGLSMLIVGVVMIGQVEDRPVFGFLFGPLLALLGLVFLAVTAVKRLATETLDYDGRAWTHAFTLGRWRWSERQVKSAAPRWRIQVHALRGAHIELVAEDGVLVMASGATSRSRLDLDQLSRLPGRFAVAGMDSAA